MDGTIILPGQDLLAQRGARQADGRARVPQRAADLQRPPGGRDRRRCEPDLDHDVQRSLLRRGADHHPPAAPVLHLPLSDGAGGNRLVGRPGDDLEERLAGCDSRRYVLHGHVDHRPLLLVEARAQGDDETGEPHGYVAGADDHDLATRRFRPGRRTSSSRQGRRGSRSATPARSSATGSCGATSATRGATTPRTRSSRSARRRGRSRSRSRSRSPGRRNAAATGPPLPASTPPPRARPRPRSHTETT